MRNFETEPVAIEPNRAVGIVYRDPDMVEAIRRLRHNEHFTTQCNRLTG